MVLELVKNTFSYSQLDKQQEGTMNTLFSLRAEKLREEFSPAQFSLMKRTGTNFRIFKKIQENIDIEDAIWTVNHSYNSQEWIDYIFAVANSISNIEAVFDREYGANNNIDYEDLKNICILWISGKRYSNIAAEIEISIDTVLSIIHDFIGYKLALIASQIIRTVEQQRPETDPLPDFFSQWIIATQNGFYSNIHYHLFQLGFSERIGLLHLGTAYTTRYNEKDTESTIKNHIYRNFDSLIKDLPIDTPKIAIQELKNNYDYLKRTMW